MTDSRMVIMMERFILRVLTCSGSLEWKQTHAPLPLTGVELRRTAKDVRSVRLLVTGHHDTIHHDR
jgi:hypothetical protein